MLPEFRKRGSSQGEHPVKLHARRYETRLGKIVKKGKPDPSPGSILLISSVNVSLFVLTDESRTIAAKFAPILS
jgi:hypothetical protein